MLDLPRRDDDLIPTRSAIVAQESKDHEQRGAEEQEMQERLANHAFHRRTNSPAYQMGEV